MKKGIIIIILLILLQPIKIEARAGGGGSSGGGSSGSGSHSNHNHYDDYDQGNRNPIVGYLSTGLAAMVITGFTIYQRRERALKLHRKAKQELAKLDDEDQFWNEAKIKQKVEACYYQIQIAWSNEDLEVLKDYLTPELYQSWEIKLNWQSFQGRKNQLSDIKLIKHDVVSVYDDDDNDKDYFWVYIEGKMLDQIVDVNNQIIESNDERFVEYWKFRRKDDRIYLDMILQQDEFER